MGWMCGKVDRRGLGARAAHVSAPEVGWNLDTRTPLCQRGASGSRPLSRGLGICRGPLSAVSVTAQLSSRPCDRCSSAQCRTLTVTVETRQGSGIFSRPASLHLRRLGPRRRPPLDKRKPSLTPGVAPGPNVRGGPHLPPRPRRSAFPSGRPESPARPAASAARRSPPRRRLWVRPRWTGAFWSTLGTSHGRLGTSWGSLYKEKCRSAIQAAGSGAHVTA